MNLYQNLLRNKKNPIDNFIFDALAMFDDGPDRERGLKVLEVGAPKQWDIKGRNNGDFSTLTWLEDGDVSSVLVVEPDKKVADKAAKNLGDLEKIQVFNSNPATFVKFSDQSFDIAYIKYFSGTASELKQFKDSLGYHATKIVIDPSICLDAFEDMPKAAVEDPRDNMQDFQQEILGEFWNDEKPRKTQPPYPEASEKYKRGLDADHSQFTDSESVIPDEIKDKLKYKSDDG